MVTRCCTKRRYEYKRRGMASRIRWIKLESNNERVTGRHNDGLSGVTRKVGQTIENRSSEES